MLDLKAINKSFHKGSVNQVLALQNISLHLDQGEFVTVIGSNGAGKSTLLNGVAGSFFPDSGSIGLDGRDITTWPEHKRAGLIGRVFQDPLLGTCASLSIEQNLALALRRGKRRSLRPGVSRKERAVFQEKLQTLELGLEQRLEHRAGLLSGGQRQALTMLMATLVDPRLLLLDEHTAALDPKTADHILRLTESIVTGQQLTTLMVTHNMHQALRFGNRLIMLHQGQVILDVGGQEKLQLTVEDLLARFYDIKGGAFPSDRMLLA